ncbi:MAG: hypothetical protein DDT42_01765 [candidate division WS2 bacterium]|uniref:Peptidylprolyl isomerase n=1 Tax=Psychracetigena formicireducens TaxID=2986056 RepID=A0A9E2F7R7_PSYF1|nr:hypothetical protein [Candidatus Psychracetigena formicireducens]
MAIISKIRERSGLAVSFVAIAMILFIVGGDLLSGNSRLLSMFSDKDKIGKINGEEITYNEYQQEISTLENEFSINQQRSPNEQDMQGIREQAWNQLIMKKAFIPQTEKAGIAVSEEEQIDMVQGENLHPSVKQAFTNPQTGEFDKIS